MQGVGGVGYHLCRLLAAEGVELRVADVRASAAERVSDEFKALVVPVETVIAEDVDVSRRARSAPCSTSAPSQACGAHRGGRGEQPAREGQRRHGAPCRLGILYAPDYVINAGGIISVTREYLGGSSEAQVNAEIHGIPAPAHGDFRARPSRESPDQRRGRSLAQERIDSAQRRLVA